MSKEIKIRVIGYGQEIVQGKFSDDEIEILEKNMEDSDETLEHFILDINEILPDSYDWYERDDFLHSYGANVESASLYLIDGDDETKIDNVWDLEDEPYNGKVVSEEFYHYDGTENIITSISSEKGWIMSGIINLEDNEEFKTSNLRVGIEDIIFNNYENSLMTSIYYKDEEIYCDADTSGKSFNSYLEKREKHG